MRVVRNQDGSHISVIGVADARQNKIIGNLTETSTHTLRSMLDGVYEKIFDADDAYTYLLPRYRLAVARTLLLLGF
ncbi:unnamed protein product [Arctia plantaginis]|uniref:Uncharacterized protein n=1 Tax=Arctia plantaginis TaxID=874455 RepID=A0A8S0YLD7_ARCPL|nr:unnamed protein product [Arctia plantaginis]CAB3256906.1 unnamed protein product [Arctia plantaginis]